MGEMVEAHRRKGICHRRPSPDHRVPPKRENRLKSCGRHNVSATYGLKPLVVSRLVLHAVYVHLILSYKEGQNQWVGNGREKSSDSGKSRHANNLLTIIAQKYL